MTRRRSPFVTETVAALADRGHVVDVIVGGRHVKICWVVQGRRRFLVVGQSLSDCRTDKNARAQLRRMLRDEGARP
jgi:hypothetical protein